MRQTLLERERLWKGTPGKLEKVDQLVVEFIVKELLQKGSGSPRKRNKSVSCNKERKCHR